MKKFLFVDLDDTLFQTRSKCDGTEALVPMAFLKDGSPCSYATPPQQLLLELALREMTVIPTTARDRDTYARVRAGFDSYAVIDYGGVILEPDGQPEREWLAHMDARLRQALPDLGEALDITERFCRTHAIPARIRLIEDCGLPFYIVIKDLEGKAARLEPIESELLIPWIKHQRGDFVVHRNGNNLALLPRCLDKGHAVAHLIARLRAEHGAIVTLGVGDSRSDAGFLAACDYAIVPRGSQLSALTLGAL